MWITHVHVNSLLFHLQISHWRDVHIAYMDRNVEVSEEGAVQITFHYNISTLNLEGGFMQTNNFTMLEGKI